MKKEDLIKLAEIAEYSFKKATDRKSHSSFERADQLIHKVKLGLGFIYWQPHKDIAQAFEVLDMFKNNYISRHSDRFICEIYDNEDSRNLVSRAEGEWACEAICQAVLKASNEQGEQR